MAAIASFTQPKVLILGGSDKKSDYTELGKAVAVGGVRHAVVIGAVSGQIEAALQAAGFQAVTCGFTQMTEMVATCAKVAQPGDVVLLSTGCASFGLFKDYKDRGNQFQAAVRALSQ